jgi:hypothetical protein
MNKTQMQSAVKLEIQIDKTRKQLAALESQLADIRLAALRQVEMVKNDRSITLVFNGRRINAKKNVHNRYVVKEGKSTLKDEYFGSIHDLRYDIARGTI